MRKSMVSFIALLAGMAMAQSAVAPSALAQEIYVRGDVGYSVDGELELEGPGPSQTLDLDDEVMGSVAIGQSFGGALPLNGGVRLEAELGYRTNDIETAGFEGSEVEVWSALGNVIYDFNRSGRIRPYVGAGAGIGRLDAQLSSDGLTADEDDTDFAWQAMAGVGFQATDRLTVDLGYRFFQMPDADLDVPVQIGDGTTIESVDTQYEHQAVTLGLRYAFGARAQPVAQQEAPPPAPPVAPPAPVAPICQSTPFTVYFAHDQANLDQTANQVLDQAIQSAQGCQFGQVVVAGYTDTSGNTRYNQSLSLRRANAVATGLEARGVPRSAIQIDGFGETNLAQQTRDGVREPLNRRTVVSFNFQ